MKASLNQKGFTIAELLIVVAIIAVLVAVAIPIFTTQLESSREGVDLSNLRQAYSYGKMAAITGEYKSAPWSPYNDSVDGDWYRCNYDVSQSCAVDDIPEGYGKSNVEGLSVDISNLPNGVLFGGNSRVEPGEDHIVIYVKPVTLQVCVFFQSEYDMELVDFSGWVEENVG